MRGFIDLHAHWVAGVDDGARSFADSMNLLSALHSAGFDKVVATPHMRPGMFDNTREHLSAAYEATCAALRGVPGLPALGLSSEHFFDDVVYQRLLEGRALPYPGGHAALVEFPNRNFPVRVAHRGGHAAHLGRRHRVLRSRGVCYARREIWRESKEMFFCATVSCDEPTPDVTYAS